MKALSNKYIFTFFLCVTLFSLSAQDNLPWDYWQNPTTRDFRTIQAQVNAWFATHERGRGTGYKQWKRWEEWNAPRLDTMDQIVNIAALNYEAFKRQKASPSSNSRNVQGDWKPWSAENLQNIGSWSPGIGRVNDIAFHPTDPNTIFVGTPAGGLFKTTNHGITWTSLTDTLGSIGISGIAIDPSNTNTIYILTGDGDGLNSRSIGVYKSTNGGVSWNPTGLAWDYDDNVYGRKLILEPGFPSWMLVAASNGLWQSQNSGTTWSLVQSGNFYDIEYKPDNTQIVYASTSNIFFKSTNYGQNWTAKNAYSSLRIEIGVTPAADSLVYLFEGPSDIIVDPTQNPPDTSFGFRGVFRSGDSGENFTLILNSPNILSGSADGQDLKEQTTYDLAIAVNPSNPLMMHLGGVNIWKFIHTQSIALNALWYVPSTFPYVHADVHELIYNPINGWLYAGCDGGIFYTTDLGTTWSDITSGLDISQLYHIAGTNQDPDFMLGGMQDNGTAIFTVADTMKSLLGADGGDVLIDPQNKNILYAMTQNGDVSKSTNGGAIFNSIKPAGSGNGPFVTPWAMDIARPDTIYMGWRKDTIFRTYNGGTSWSTLILPGSAQDITSINVASNGSTVYATTCSNAFRSTNNGSSWTNIYTINSSCLTSIESVPSNVNQAIITRGGFSSLDHIWLYNSGSVTSITGTGGSPGTLPAVPVNTATAKLDGPDLTVYAGTDIGVYFFSYGNTTAGWQKFKKGLPNVPVRDFYVYPSLGLMRIATFGRGIWQSDLWDDCVYNLTLTPGNDPSGGTPGVQLNEAADFINSNRLIIGANGDVTYKAGDGVILTTGFLATEGNKFVAGIKPCGISLE